MYNATSFQDSQQAAELVAGMEALGHVLTETQLNQFGSYIALLDKKNTQLNLTRIPSAEIVPLHFLDCLAIFQILSFYGTPRLLDLGSGAGFPGLPLKIMYPQLALTLLDAARKRLDFLRNTVRALQLTNVEYIHERAELVGRTAPHREGYDYVTARAVAKLNTLVELTLPLLRVGGVAILYKSDKVDEEVASAQRALELLGGAIETATPVAIQGTDIERKLIIIKKVNSTPAEYPRSTSQIKRKPIS
ncbi:16S rRNA (guanine(527)-N(7))-methyltransferase RsmG [Oligoflexia bacterium]|nr:16S rRNA (guanine(527)-N(7))-methyltransferase RsmG [Oligoflexia bacterium]